MSVDLKLGYEVGTGKPVSIPLGHMVVAGMTQQAGKTTCLEGLIDRSQLRALAFVTKRGERSFVSAESIPAYFRERADWQFVASVLEAALREKMKFERSWIIRASKGAKTLADVQTNVRRLGAATKNGFAADMYNNLDEYLNIVVPLIKHTDFAPRVHLNPGVNVCQLGHQPAELQSLVMRSMMEWIYEKEEGVVTIIPEAAEFIPQARGSPVKLTAEQLVRKGASLKNFVWIDSQDLAGVDKLMLRGCTVWLLGVQRESNEIKRTLENIPAGTKKPKPEAIARLKKGQFIVCHGEVVRTVYAQPYWLNNADAMDIACGHNTVEAFDAPKPHPSGDTTMADMADTNKKLDTLIEMMAKSHTAMERSANIQPAPMGKPAPACEEYEAATAKGNAAAELQMIYEYVLDRLRREDPAALIELTQTRPEMVVKVKRHTIQLDETSSQGMIAILIKEGFFASTATANSAWNEAKSRWGYKGAAARFYEAARALVKLGFLREGDGGFTSTGARVRVDDE